MVNEKEPGSSAFNPSAVFSSPTQAEPRVPAGLKAPFGVAVRSAPSRSRCRRIASIPLARSAWESGREVEYDCRTPEDRVRGVSPIVCARFAAASLAIVLTALIAPAAARPASNLMFGFTENLPMVIGVEAASAERNLGASGTVFTLVWAPGKTSLTSDESEQLARGLAAVSGMRVILAVRTNGATAPIDATARDQFCSYTRNAVASFPQINDVVVGNEPNANFFWRPQYNPDGSDASPAAYEALLAQCYDLLHAYRASIDVGAPATGPDGNDNPNAVSNISHSPTTFILGLGAAYRASGRTARIFDTVVHHPYGL